MRTEQVNHLKESSEQPSSVRLRPGQIVRGKILQIFPLDRARIQLGSFQFIAQLEAPLDHGQSYFFQVKDVKNEVHLQVIQQTTEQGASDWKQLLRSLGSKHSKVREQFVQQLLRTNIPFTKKTLQQMFMLLDQHPNQDQAMKALKGMAERSWPLTKETLESIIRYQSSTFTKESHGLLKSLTEQSHISAAHRNLIQQLELLMPEDKKVPRVLQQLFEYITTKDATREFPLIEMLHPKINKTNVQALQSMPISERAGFLQTPERMLTYLGFHTTQKYELLEKSLTTLAKNIPEFQQKVQQFIHTWERHVQMHAVQYPSEVLKGGIFRQLQDSYLQVFQADQWTKENQATMRESIPNHPRDLLETMVRLKALKTQNLQQMLGQALKSQQSVESEVVQTKFLRAFQHILQNIGLSYEHELSTARTEQLNNTLKALLLQIVHEQIPSSERAQSLLRFIQGMQLHTVQDTGHLLSVQLQIPAMIGSLRSDMQITFESKKTASESIDPDHCRILFDLDLATIKRTLIDMHIQNKQISLTIYNDLPFLKEIGGNYEEKLTEGLLKEGYQLTSIRYLSIRKQEDIKRKRTPQSFTRKEGFDIKI